MRHRFFPPTAGDMQGLLERVLAPQRGLDNIGRVLRGWPPLIAFFRDEGVLPHGPARQSLAVATAADR